MTEQDREQLANQIPNVLAGFTEIQQMEPASNKWASSVDELRKVEGPKVAKYNSMATEFDADGGGRNGENPATRNIRRHLRLPLFLCVRTGCDSAPDQHRCAFVDGVHSVC